MKAELEAISGSNAQAFGVFVKHAIIGIVLSGVFSKATPQKPCLHYACKDEPFVNAPTLWRKKRIGIMTEQWGIFWLKVYLEQSTK